MAGGQKEKGQGWILTAVNEKKKTKTSRKKKKKERWKKKPCSTLE